jgi:rRNA maturation protein Nop10
MPKKICNQVLMNEQQLGALKGKYVGGKCLECGEQTLMRLPVTFTLFNNWLKAFTSLHKVKGCNATEKKI